MQSDRINEGPEDSLAVKEGTRFEGGGDEMREDVGDRRAERQAARASIYISENSTDKIRFHFQLGRLRSRFGDLCHPQSSPARPPSPSSDRLGCTLEGREYSPIGMKAE